MRPIFHRKGENIEAHLNLAVLAYFIVSFIRYKLKSSKIHYCWSEIEYSEMQFEYDYQRKWEKNINQDMYKGNIKSR